MESTISVRKITIIIRIIELPHTVLLQINALLPLLQRGIYLKIWKYENYFVINHEDITEAAPQFIFDEEDDVINVEDDILVVD